jgi:hypothetical protein
MQKIIFAIGAVVLLSTTHAMAQQGEIIREECAADIRARVETWRRAGSGPALTPI